MTARVAVRQAEVGDVTAMQVVATDAGERFREHGDVRISERANDPPYSTEGLTRAINDRRAWVALDDQGSVIGFSVAWTVDGEAHLDELAVTPEHGRRGVGRALVDEVVAWASTQRLPSITLTTFRDVPWNRPYYEKLGFQVVTRLTPTLQSLVDRQAGWGLDPALRVVMRRNLADATHPPDAPGTDDPTSASVRSRGDSTPTPQLRRPPPG